MKPMISRINIRGNVNEAREGTGEVKLFRAWTNTLPAAYSAIFLADHDISRGDV